MRSLAGTSISDEFLQSMFIQRLPTNVRSILAVTKDDLDAQATMADKIVEYSPTPQFCAINKNSTSRESCQSSSLDERLRRLESMVANIRTEIKNISSRRSDRRVQVEPCVFRRVFFLSLATRGGVLWVPMLRH
ncbi:Reverse transcriptase (RNA-dependent DNA polymerase) [Nesidiocoris tenuis]|uniref:Reverse transcriptase (RNA-dependent DNA polymerase) n=1 Tax=Nesidiocoris tenuis TaxID=355587 RepID=A0ABN7AH85_9HEMI|nr:Reverse transcriptase (RNA-dependent DNA polymerase) [Nesidiocoris tenuis]